MNKRKDILDEIRYKYLHSKDVGCEMFLRMMLDYYVKNDLVTGDHLAPIFYSLYMSPESTTFDNIVYKYSIGLSTLNRYRKNFNKLAVKLLPAC